MATELIKGATEAFNSGNIQPTGSSDLPEVAINN